jgi:hypothetical protein
MEEVICESEAIATSNWFLSKKESETPIGEFEKREEGRDGTYNLMHNICVPSKHARVYQTFTTRVEHELITRMRNVGISTCKLRW